MPSARFGCTTSRTLNLRGLEAFVAVVEHGKLTRAAEALYTDPSTISKLLTQLDEAAGTLLLIRTTRSVTLTPAGQAALHLARRLLTQVDDLESHAAELIRQLGKPAEGTRGD